MFVNIPVFKRAQNLENVLQNVFVVVDVMKNVKESCVKCRIDDTCKLVKYVLLDAYNVYEK